MIILVLTKNNFAKNLRFWCGFKKVAKETLWSYFVTEKFTNQLLWKLLGTQKVSERMIMKVMVAPQSHYEIVEKFCAKIMKVMVASKSCREVIDSIRFLFLVKTYFTQPRSLNFFSLHPILFWVKTVKWCLFICCGDKDQKQHALAGAFFFFLLMHQKLRSATRSLCWCLSMNIWKWNWILAMREAKTDNVCSLHRHKCFQHVLFWSIASRRR